MSPKQKLVSAKNKIVKNQTKILSAALVVTTTAAAIMINHKVQSDKFLKEKDLYEEYYTVTEED